MIEKELLSEKERLILRERKEKQKKEEEQKRKLKEHFQASYESFKRQEFDNVKQQYNYRRNQINQTLAGGYTEPAIVYVKSETEKNYKEEEIA